LRAGFAILQNLASTGTVKRPEAASKFDLHTVAAKAQPAAAQETRQTE
jgi:hypothetical protein